MHTRHSERLNKGLIELAPTILFQGRPLLVFGVGRQAYWRKQSPKGNLLVDLVDLNNDAVAERAAHHNLAKVDTSATSHREVSCEGLEKAGSNLSAGGGILRQTINSDAVRAVFLVKNN